ncbi:MAG TPA: DUF2071 domain-containing protein [Oculatellaceae cyanobacterium]
MIHPLLAKVDHRPFPVPQSTWVMSQVWEKLLFAHWPVETSKLRDLIPRSLDIDVFDGTAWVGVVPFLMRDVHPRYTWVVPPLSNFLELNVRTYVTKNGIPGVYFFSLDCSNSFAVWTAKSFYHLPYFNATMSSRCNSDGVVTYESKRRESSAQFMASYKPTGPWLSPGADSLDKFLTERYCLYTTNKHGKLFRGVIHHHPWPLQPAEAEINVNTMTDATLNLKLPDCQPILHYSERLETIEWALVMVL